MKVLGIGMNSVTVELDPRDCFLLAEACRQAVNHDAATDLEATDLLEQTMTLAAMAAACWDASTGSQGLAIEEVRANWLPPDKR